MRWNRFALSAAPAAPTLLAGAAATYRLGTTDGSKPVKPAS